MCRRKPATVRSGLFLLTKETYLRKVQDNFHDLMKKASPAARVLSGGAFSSTFCISARSRSGRTRQERQSATTAARGSRSASSSSRCACRRGAKPREPCPHANARPCRGERASGRGCALCVAPSKTLSWRKTLSRTVHSSRSVSRCMVTP